MTANTTMSPRLERLLGFLEKDKGNLSLLGDTATAAFEEHAFDLANELIARHPVPLPPPLTNLKGLVALAQQRFEDAAAIFTELRAGGTDNPPLRFNLAWAEAMMGAHQEALNLLDDETVAVSPRAPALKIQMMHHLDLYDEALTTGADLAARYPDNQALMGTLATLALDAEKADLALDYAKRAGDNPEGRAALGILTLGEYEPGKSLEMFDQALASQPGNARAWVGKGLALLISGDAKAGAEAIDKGAEIFNDHLGSWVASGWAHFINGDYAKARASFERSLAADPNFAESHGGLAVMDILDGKLDEAKHETEIALRLDKKCFGGALAKSMLLERSGHAQMAQKIREMAMSTPVGPGGQTIAQALVGFSSGLRK